MRYLPIVLLLGILLNFACVVVFRLKLDRKSDERFMEFSRQVKTEIRSLTVDALQSIDNYFLSNSVVRASSPSSPDSTSSRLPASDFFHIDGGSWDYDYYKCDGVSFARVGFVSFREGDFFPRGGRITSIYPDSVVVDGKYHVRNSSLSRPLPSFSVSDLSKSKEIGGSKDVARVDTNS